MLHNTYLQADKKTGKERFFTIRNPAPNTKNPVSSKASFRETGLKIQLF